VGRLPHALDLEAVGMASHVGELVHRLTQIGGCRLPRRRVEHDVAQALVVEEREKRSALLGGGREARPRQVEVEEPRRLGHQLLQVVRVRGQPGLGVVEEPFSPQLERLGPDQRRPGDRVGQRPGGQVALELVVELPAPAQRLVGGAVGQGGRPHVRADAGQVHGAHCQAPRPVQRTQQGGLEGREGRR
jgi:hypothetical protein